ncbi:GNAT family N-acetyltransferase [Sutterella sp.]|uniref:GNAT family N-acetyltransferase n=1 Tax=Sutterella sp. TaxID=1981025 RepID=UPI0026E0D258|nr:GNAT family N-acetyltransferase [Sutterella sp.]MDO5532167.1 GNAT family N-acetyltransferase [Sutterella sp.]
MTSSENSAADNSLFTRPVLRPFEPDDLARMNAAYDLTWGWEIDPDRSATERRALGEAYQIANLLKSDFIRVAALEDGRAGALMCARLGLPETEPATDGLRRGLTPAMRRAYTEIRRAREIELGSSGLGRDVLEFEAGITAVNKGMLAELMNREAAAKAPAELVYLIAHPDARGRGCASALLRAFEAECRAAGHPRAMLFTDDHCNRGIYLRRGWAISETDRWDAGGEAGSIESYLFTKRFA